MAGELTIRPARPDDRLAVERICAQTWDWGDYVPEVWDDWLTDERGVLLVGELGATGERVVALSKITFHSPDQVWLQGMRVDPGYRRRGIAGRFLDYGIAHARKHGARVVRLGTGGHNTPVHNMVARAGMVRVGNYVLWIAEPLPDGSLPTFLTPDDAPRAQAFLKSSPLLAYTRVLYSFDWVWQELSAERVTHFLAAGQVVAQFSPAGGLAALALIRFDPDDETLWVGFADGHPPAVTVLAMAIRAHAAQVGAQKAWVMLPDVAWLRESFRAAGYDFGDWDGELWIFERWLAQNSEDDHDG